jgi:hypothetical protein
VARRGKRHERPFNPCGGRLDGEGWDAGLGPLLRGLFLSHALAQSDFLRAGVPTPLPECLMSGVREYRAMPRPVSEYPDDMTVYLVVNEYGQHGRWRRSRSGRMASKSRRIT